MLIVVALAGLFVPGASSRELIAGTPGASPSPAEQAKPPVLAYYYIWYDTSSWNRAKTDYPLLGRYSSDDQEIMRQHVRWAKAAGINGFIVSWKNTETLSKRLATLVEICREEHFKLAIIYQGLDFSRNPLETSRISADLDYLIQTYRQEPVFDIFGRPLVIWSGSWEFSREQIAQVTSHRRDDLLILGSEKSADDYVAKADLFDGDAYYWSSVNPHTYPGYPEKLRSMANAVHAHNGLWIAPAAPGFDARLVGGERIVDREDGNKLRLQVQTAENAAPDAIGLISWNEFSENSQIEPSCEYGSQSLAVIAEIEDGTLAEDVPTACPEGTPAATPVISNGIAVAAAPTVTAVPTRAPTMSPTPWPTSKVSTGFVDPVRPNANSDYDSSSPAATDRTIGRMARIGMLISIVVFLVALAIVRARHTRAM
jgi:hypothetical protein